MRDRTAPKIPKWPFFLGYGFLLGVVALIYAHAQAPLEKSEIAAYVLCAAAGAGLCVWPFVLEYRAVVTLAEAEGVSTVVAQIRNLEQLAAQIGYATSQWQVVREAADKTAGSAKEIAQSMAAEVNDFNEFLKRANEGEKVALRLEVDKLRRAEGDWIQVLVRILDHVYALHQAGLRSRQELLITQLGQFQNACRDAARRVGLTPFTAAPGEAYDERRHQLAETAAKPGPEARIEETLAPGYTFQGKLLRPVLVRLEASGVPSGGIDKAEISAGDQGGQLSLNPAGELE